MKSSVRLALIAIAVGLASACSHLPEMPQMPAVGGRADAARGTTLLGVPFTGKKTL